MRRTRATKTTMLRAQQRGGTQYTERQDEETRRAETTSNASRSYLRGGRRWRAYATMKVTVVTTYHTNIEEREQRPRYDKKRHQLQPEPHPDALFSGDLGVDCKQKNDTQHTQEGTSVAIDQRQFMLQTSSLEKNKAHELSKTVVAVCCAQHTHNWMNPSRCSTSSRLTCLLAPQRSRRARTTYPSNKAIEYNLEKVCLGNACATEQMLACAGLPDRSWP